MKNITAFIFVLFLSVPAFAANNWYVHNGTDHFEGRYSQADAQAMATANGWTAVKGIGSVPQAVKDARAAKEAQAASDREARRQRIIARLSGLSDAQIDTYIDNNVTNLAGAVAYLKRLTKVVRDLAINVNGDE